MEYIHKICRCLGREFTFDEWRDYSMAHPHSMSETVHRNKYGFGFNIHDVCMNPDVDVSIESKYGCVEVNTARSDNGRWEYGYRSTIVEWIYSGYPCSFVAHKEHGFATKNDALFEALDTIRSKAEDIDCFSKHFDRLSDGRSYSAARALLKGFVRMIDQEKQRLTFVQLKLF